MVAKILTNATHFFMFESEVYHADNSVRAYSLRLSHLIGGDGPAWCSRWLQANIMPDQRGTSALDSASPTMPALLAATLRIRS